MLINPNPENLTRASPSLKLDVMLATINYIDGRLSFKASEPGGPDIDQYNTLDIQMPHFVASRLPTPESTEYGSIDVTNNLRISEHLPGKADAPSLRFVGKISLIRRQTLVTPFGRQRHEWTVSYAVNSLRRSLIRQPIVGEVVSYDEGRRTPVRRLYEQEPIVQAKFPRLFATTEAWQLLQLYENPIRRTHSPPPTSAPLDSRWGWLFDA